MHFCEAKPVCPGTTLVQLLDIIGEMWTFDNTFFQTITPEAIATNYRLSRYRLFLTSFEGIAPTKQESSKHTRGGNNEEFDDRINA